jgi:hypothetical protein
MKRIFSVICFFSVLVTFLSCGKEAKQFDGKWELITAPVSGFDYFWTFQETDSKEGLISITTYDTLSGEIDTCSKGDFFVKNNVLAVGAPIKFCEWSTFDGEWDIHKLNSEFLTLIRYLPRGTMYLELIKR